MMPLVNNVPGYEQIRIHPGNTDGDTLGCILVGEGRGVNNVSMSRAAFNKFYPKLEAALKAGEKVWLTIKQ